MKNSILIAILLSYSIHTFSQETKEVNLIQTDSTWGQEIIQIPFWFAEEINYKGVEDIRFAKGWGDVNSPGFWNLVLAWDINLNTKPTTTFFEENLKLYFDGLMNVVNENKNLTIPKTKVVLTESKTLKETTHFTGTVNVYDAFTTKKMILLQVTIDSYYCNTSKKYLPFFKFSPKNFNSDVWKTLNNIKLRDHICNN